MCGAWSREVARSSRVRQVEFEADFAPPGAVRPWAEWQTLRLRWAPSSMCSVSRFEKLCVSVIRNRNSQGFYLT